MTCWAHQTDISRVLVSPLLGPAVHVLGNFLQEDTGLLIKWLAGVNTLCPRINTGAHKHEGALGQGVEGRGAVAGKVDLVEQLPKKLHYIRMAAEVGGQYIAVLTGMLFEVWLHVKVVETLQEGHSQAMLLRGLP